VSASNKPPFNTALNDRYKIIKEKGQFDFKQIARVAIALLKANIWPLISASSVIVFTVLAFALLIANSFPLEELTGMPAQQQGILDIAMIIIVAPLSAGLSVMGINIARRQKVTMTDIFKFVSWVLPLALAQLLISVLVQLGLAVLIIPGLYVFVASTFTLPLIADKKMGVLQAVMASCRAVNQYLLSFIVLFVIFLVLFLLSIFTFGLGFLVIMPLYFVVTGLLYTTIFDTAEDQQALTGDRQESTFDA